jgi:hypothetical protein
VTLTATLTPSTATGKVTFYGNVVLGTSSLSGGTATLNVLMNATGSRSLLARYLGDSNNSGTASPVNVETVRSVPATGFVQKNISPPTGVAILRLRISTGMESRMLSLLGAITPLTLSREKHDPLSIDHKDLDH